MSIFIVISAELTFDPFDLPNGFGWQRRFAITHCYPSVACIQTGDINYLHRSVIKTNGQELGISF